MNKKILLLVLILLNIAVFGYYVHLCNKKYNLVIMGGERSTSTPNIATSSGSALVAKTMEVKIALLGIPTADSDKKDIRACDSLIMSERQVPYSKAPLDAALKELFSKKNASTTGDSTPWNFISSQKDLFFDRVSIVDGVAKIYLTGKIGPLGGVCDDPRLKTQLQETALQFPSVKSVEFYLNNIKASLFISETGE